MVDSQRQADRRSEFELSEGRVEDEHSSAGTALEAKKSQELRA